MLLWNKFNWLIINKRDVEIWNYWNRCCIDFRKHESPLYYFFSLFLLINTFVFCITYHNHFVVKPWSSIPTSNSLHIHSVTSKTKEHTNVYKKMFDWRDHRCIGLLSNLKNIGKKIIVGIVIGCRLVGKGQLL